MSIKRCISSRLLRSCIASIFIISLLLVNISETTAYTLPSDTTKENSFVKLIKSLKSIFSKDTAAEAEMKKAGKKAEGKGLWAILPFNKQDKTSAYFGQSPHFNHHRIYKDTALSSEQAWSDLQHIDETYNPSEDVETKGDTLHPSIQVFGFHPYWMGNAYQSYMYDFLSTVAYYCYDVEPRTGKPKSLYNWNTTGVIDSMHNHGKSAVLTISCSGLGNNSLFLARGEAQRTLMQNVLGAMAKRKANGVCIDFEDVPGSLKKEFNRFVCALADTLHQANAGYKVSLCLPAIDFYGAYDIAALKKKVDLFILMGYDYYSNRSAVAGPTAPLMGSKTWGAYSVDWSVNYYVQQGLPPANLLLSVPYYGTKWHTKTQNKPSDKIEYLGNYPYYAICEEFGIDSFQVDSESSTEYHTYLEEMEDHQVWFDGSKGLSAKYQYVLSKGLGGIAIWTLGYDQGYPDLWQLLVDHFSSTAVEAFRNPLQAADTNGTAGAAAMTNATGTGQAAEADTVGKSPQDVAIAKNGLTLIERFLLAANDDDLGSTVLIILSILTVFFMLGFLIGFANFNLSMLYKERLVVVYFIIFMSLISAIVLIQLTNKENDENDPKWTNISMGVVITLIFMSVFYFVKRQKKERP